MMTVRIYAVVAVDKLSSRLIDVTPPGSKFGHLTMQRNWAPASAGETPVVFRSPL
jgi:hypothetical protein